MKIEYEDKTAGDASSLVPHQHDKDTIMSAGYDEDDQHLANGNVDGQLHLRRQRSNDVKSRIGPLLDCDDNKHLIGRSPARPPKKEMIQLMSQGYKKRKKNATFFKLF